MPDQINPWYTKGETDALLNNKQDVGFSYSKNEIIQFLKLKQDADYSFSKDEVIKMLKEKADIVNTITPGAVQDLLSGKEDKGYSYSKNEVNVELAKKVNIGDIRTNQENEALFLLKTNSYDRNQIDEFLKLKVDSSAVYSVDEADKKFALKANSADVYTKTVIDAKLADLPKPIPCEYTGISYLFPIVRQNHLIKLLFDDTALKVDGGTNELTLSDAVMAKLTLAEQQGPQIAQLITKVTTLEGQAVGFEAEKAKVTKNAKDIEGIKINSDKVPNLEQRIAALESKSAVFDLERTQNHDHRNDLEDGITLLIDRMDAAERDITSDQNGISQNSQQIQNLETLVHNQTTRIEDLEQRIAELVQNKQ